MTNPTSSQQSQVSCRASTSVGHVAKASLFCTLRDGSEVVCTLEDGQTVLFERDRSRQVQTRNFKNLKDMRSEFPGFYQELRDMLQNVVDFNGVDLPVSRGLQTVNPTLGLLGSKDVVTPLVNASERLDPPLGLQNNNSMAGHELSCVEPQGVNSIEPLTGYFERATPVGSQQAESAREESGEDVDDDDDDDDDASFSITAEANNLNNSESGEYFKQATPVSSSQREWLMGSSFHDEAVSSPDTPETQGPVYQSSFEFHSSVTETERSLERDIERSLQNWEWGDLFAIDDRPDEIPDD